MTTRRQFLTSSGALVVYFTLPGCGNSLDATGNAAKAAGGSAGFGDRIVIHTSGAVTLHMGKVELGQGIGTAIAQVAAEELGVDLSRIKLTSVDT